MHMVHYKDSFCSINDAQNNNDGLAVIAIFFKVISLLFHFHIILLLFYNFIFNLNLFILFSIHLLEFFLLEPATLTLEATH